MSKDIFSMIEGMSDVEKNELLNAEIPAELEKQAEADLDQASLADALYNYGWLSAERAIAEEEGLDKFASEDLEAHENSEKEIGEAIESLMSSLGVADSEDEVELHKEAQAAASLIFEGYSDCFEKLAAKQKASFIQNLSKKTMAGLKAAKEKTVEKAREAAKAAKKGAKEAVKGAHNIGKKGGYGAIGGAGALYLGAKAKQKLEKKASEMTVGELYEGFSEKIAAEMEIMEGIDKLAAKGAKKAKKIIPFMAKVKEVAEKAHKAGKKGLYAGLGGAGAGFAAGKASNED
jgi:hypothetical protein